MQQSKTPPPLQQRFLRQLTALWPVLKGSLALVHKPCIRPRCPACARGDKHPAYLLSFTKNRRRLCRYVPSRLVPLLRRALKNGRRLEALLYAIGPALIREHRQSRQKSSPTTRKSAAHKKYLGTKS